MIHLLQLDEKVPPGRFGDFLREADFPHRLVRVYSGDRLPEVSRQDGIVVFGGTMGANDEADYPFLEPLKEFLWWTVEDSIPLLGICLGGQILAAVLGGRVNSASRGEKGVRMITLTEEGKRDSLFFGIPQRFEMFQWHNDSFDPPPEATPLASSPTCPGQAFRYRNAWGVQFHPEVSAKIVGRWSSRVDSSGAYLRDFQRVEKIHDRVAYRLLENFISAIGSPVCV